MNAILTAVSTKAKMLPTLSIRLKLLLLAEARKSASHLDASSSLVQEIDDIRMRIGVDRGALVKIWLYERIKQEKDIR